MTPVFQQHNIPRFGDCFRACVASILDLTIDSVPNFNLLCIIRRDKYYWDLVQEFLDQHGLILLQIQDTNFIGDGYYIQLVYPKGSSVNDLHAVVVKDGMIIHDPAPIRSWLSERMLYLPKFAITFIPKKQQRLPHSFLGYHPELLT